MRKAKVDTNQPAIVAGLRDLGISVSSIAEVGFGVPDLVIGYGGCTWLVEVKQPGRPLTPLQRCWHSQWRGNAIIATSVVEVLRVMLEDPLSPEETQHLKDALSKASKAQNRA
jgi:hypothetical protein